MALRTTIALALTVALIAIAPAADGAGSSGKSGSSSKSGSSKGGGLSSGSKGGFGSSKSKSDSSKSSSKKPAASKSSSRSSKHSSSKSSSRSTKGVAPGPAAPSAPVHEDGSVADDVRIRGGYFSESTFAKLPCDPVEIEVGERRCWRCGDDWFEKLVYDGQPVYVEVFGPEGARADALPAHVERVRGEGATYFAAANAIYAPVEGGDGGFVVVSTSPGFRLEEFPNSAHVGVPIVVGDVTYYRYLGVYYREEYEDDDTYYVASESPF